MSVRPSVRPSVRRSVTLLVTHVTRSDICRVYGLVFSLLRHFGSYSGFFKALPMAYCVLPIPIWCWVPSTFKIFHTFITIFSLVSGITFTIIVIDHVKTASMLARIRGTIINIWAKEFQKLSSNYVIQFLGFKIFNTFITIVSRVSRTTFRNITIVLIETASMLARIRSTVINSWTNGI